ncbi:hypothetical protein Pan153_15620 [Gimesia panareensis]|uniref:Uncharacterized protein n=1 Tax=Gimesia panareensis TaxID=2527978 RepID=A0A518FKQ0_9PLAN|nr:hypothetical protein [Gimesia panareensis]QDV16928.1 hypothetical protein Pan153_15620 [Gimesia panareensis]
MNNDTSVPEEESDETSKNLTIVIDPVAILKVVICFFCYVALISYLRSHNLLKAELTSSVLLGIFLVTIAAQYFIFISSKRKLDAYLRTNPVIQDQDSLMQWKTISQTHNQWERIGVKLLFGLLLPMSLLICISSGFKSLNMAIVGVFLLLDLVLNVWTSSSQNKMEQLECSDESLKPEYQRACDEWQHRLAPDFKIDPGQ